MICVTAPGSKVPCRFASICPEERQRQQHYADLRGTACWAFQKLSEKQKVVEVDERTCIQEEGNS